MVSDSIKVYGRNFRTYQGRYDEETFNNDNKYTHSCYLRYASPVSRLTSKTVGKDEQGRNELTMSNMPGREQVYLKAEKDYDELVQHDYNQTILNNKTSM